MRLVRIGSALLLSSVVAVAVTAAQPRIVHGDFDVEATEIGPADPFANLRGLGNDVPSQSIQRSSRNPTESISKVSPDHLADE